MGFSFVVVVLCAVALFGAASADKKACIKAKYETSLGEPFTSCFDTKTSLEIARMKQCWTDIMKTENVVKVANNGQMTVDYTKFGDYGRDNDHLVGRGMKACHEGTSADHEMYQEAARASQCVFDKLKKGCK